MVEGSSIQDQLGAGMRARQSGRMADAHRHFEAVLALDPAQPTGIPENKWSPLDRSLDWSAPHLWRDGERIDDVCARAPKTAALVDELPLCRIPGRAFWVLGSSLRL